MNTQTFPVMGVSDDADLKEHWVRRDTRPFYIKNKEKIVAAGPILIALYAFLFIIFPLHIELLLLLGLFLRLFLSGSAPFYPLAQPEHKAKPWAKRTVGDAFLILGIEKGTGRLIAQNKTQSLEHYLLMGTTGSGKTRTILSLIYSGALMWCGGATLVDGKGDSLTFWLLYRLARRVDRTDDLMIINFLNGGKESGSRASPVTRLSNTNNSWATAVSEMISEMIAGMMPSSGGDAEYWRGRARIMVGSLLRILCHLRDRGELVVDVTTLRHHMTLAKLMTLAKREDINKSKKAGLLAYLLDLGITEQELEFFGTENQLDFAPKVIEQHGYLQQQTTEILGTLGDTFRHVFGVRYGEVDWGDIIFRKKLCFVMLPALEKAPDTVSSLGRLIFSGLRAALAPALGDVLEGTYAYVMSKKIANSRTPYLLIFDEWGAYATLGAALFVTQLRGLGIMCCLASQDEPGMRKDEKLDRETKSIIGSTNTKICMRIEEMEDTYGIFKTGGSTARIAVKEGDKLESEFGMRGYFNEGSTNIEERDRINSRDLKDQDAGEATLLYKDKVIRMMMTFVEPDEVQYARINQWMDILPSNVDEMKKFSSNGKSSLFTDKDLAERNDTYDLMAPSCQSDSLAVLFDTYKHAMKLTDEDAKESGICAVAQLVKESEVANRKIKALFKTNKDNADFAEDNQPDRQPTQGEIPGVESSGDAAKSKITETVAKVTAETQNTGDIEPTSSEETLPEEGDQVTISDVRAEIDNEVSRKRNLYLSALHDSVSQELGKIEDLTPAERLPLTIYGQLKRAQSLLEVEDEVADITRSLETIKGSAPEHPIKPVPDKMNSDSLVGVVNKLRQSIKDHYKNDD